jgi:Leucine-rich repeat (LRR) protein
MATFITSKSIGQNIGVNAQTSTGYWKYNHDGTDSSVFEDGKQTITVANANGEFTIIPCLSDGTVSGGLTQLNLENNQLTSFDGTGLSGLTQLGLSNNQLTSFDGTGLSGLTYLNLSENQLTSFDGTGLSGLTVLSLMGPKTGGGTLTSVSNLPATLNLLSLNNNQLTSFDGTDLTSLIELYLGGNQLTSFDGTGLSGLTQLYLSNNQLTSFDGTDLTSLIELYLGGNQLTSLDVLPMVSLIKLFLTDPYGLNGNPMTAVANNTILSGLVTKNSGGGGNFYTSGGRTSAGTSDYDTLIGDGWNLLGLDLVITSSGKLRVKGVNTSQ